MLEILFQNDELIAINKPHGMLVHRSGLARDASVFAVQELRNQIGQHVYPAHRLDRKTGGVLLFAKKKEAAGHIQQLFIGRDITKIYHAVIRGFTPDSGQIDYALEDEKGRLKEAITLYKTIAKTEIDLPFGKFNTSRYSLIEAKPITGRMHQIRRHMAHIRHPIIADRPHGCNKQNRLFKEKWHMDTMLLHASELSFEWEGKRIDITAKKQSEFRRSLDILRFN